MQYHAAFYHLQSTFPSKTPIHPLSGINIVLHLLVRTLRLRGVKTLVQSFIAHQRLNWTKLRHSRQLQHSLRKPASFQGTIPELSSLCSFSFFLLKTFLGISSNHSPLPGSRPCVLSLMTPTVPDKVRGASFTELPLLNSCPRHGPCLSAPLSLLTIIHSVNIITFQACNSISGHLAPRNTCTYAQRFMCSDVWCSIGGNSKYLTPTGSLAGD